MAAGLQGKFKEMHEAILEYPEMSVPDSFIEETAALYGIDSKLDWGFTVKPEFGWCWEIGRLILDVHSDNGCNGSTHYK